MRFFVFLVLSHVSICLTQKNCNEEQSEKRFLSNIDKLLDMNHVKIARGLFLKKKENAPIEAVNQKPQNNTSVCNYNLVESVGLRMKRMMETHVIQFDLSAILQKG